MGGAIPDETKREILQRIDLAQLVGEVVTLRKAGRRFVGLCPFHAEKTPSFSVNQEEGFYYCFGCHAAGDAITFLRETQGLEFREAVEQLAARAGVTLPEDEVDAATLRSRARNRDERARIIEANALAQAFFRANMRRDVGAKAREYLAGRAIDDATAERYELGVAPPGWDGLVSYLQRGDIDAAVAEKAGLVVRSSRGGGYYDRFRDRLTFPIRDLTGKVVGFSARLLGAAENEPKYVNTPETAVFRKGEMLFGMVPARRALRATRRAVLVEGNVDVLRLAQAGIENVVAPLGTAATEAHVLLLKRFVDRVDILFDADTAGDAAAAKVTELLLANGLGGRLVRLPDGEDPDSFLAQREAIDLEELVRRAPALSEWFVDRALELYDGSIPSKTRVIAAARPLFGWLTSDVERDEFERRIEQHIELSPGTLGRYLEVPDALSRLDVPDTATASVSRRAPSQVELETIRLLLAYPHLIGTFVERGGPALFEGEKRREVLERCIAHHDVWKGTLDGLALIEEFEEPRIRDFVARALNEEPDVPEEAAERAFEDCMEQLQERARRAKQREIAEKLRKGPAGELTEEAREMLRERLRLAQRGTETQTPPPATSDSDASEDASAGPGRGMHGQGIEGFDQEDPERRD